MPALFLSATLATFGCGDNVHTTKLIRPAKFLTSIVSLSPSTTEIVGDSTVSSLLKGRTASDDYPKTVESVPVVASVKPDYEAIKKLGPDLVMYDADLYNAEDAAKIKALNIQTYVLDSKSVADFEKKMYEIGDILNCQMSLNDYVDRIEVAKNTALASKPSSPIKVAVIMPGGGGADMIVGTKSFLADAVRIAGGTVVGPETDRFVPLSPEMLVAQNPDFIVFPSSTESVAKNVDEILHDPKLASTNAVKNKKFAAIDQDVLLRKGDRVDKLISNLQRGLAMGTKS